MKFYNYLFVVLAILFVQACNSSSARPSTLVHSLSFDYENLNTGETGSIHDFYQQTAGMGSALFRSEPGPEPFGHSASVNSTIKNFEDADTRDPLRFNLGFSGLLPGGAAVKPMDGQLYGQLYTYVDPQSYLSDFFPLGQIVLGSTMARIIFSVKGDEYSSYMNNTQLLEDPESELIITAHQLVRDQNDQLNLVLKVEFKATTFYPNFPDFALGGAPAYRLTNGEINFFFPIANPGE